MVHDINAMTIVTDEQTNTITSQPATKLSRAVEYGVTDDPNSLVAKLYDKADECLQAFYKHSQQALDDMKVAEHYLQRGNAEYHNRYMKRCSNQRTLAQRAWSSYSALLDCYSNVYETL